MIVEINARCRVKSDAYQWTLEPKHGDIEKNWRATAFFRTLDLALDALIEAGLCIEPELAEARAIAALLEQTKTRIDALLADQRDAPIPAEVAATGSYMTASGAINYWFLKQAWAAGSAAEIPVLAEKAQAFAVSAASMPPQTARSYLNPF